MRNRCSGHRLRAFEGLVACALGGRLDAVALALTRFRIAALRSVALDPKAARPTARG